MSRRFASRVTRPLLGVVLGVVLFGTDTPTHAQTAVDAAAKERAKQHFAKGKAAFELGKFSQALTHYEQAYKILPLPGFLFNIGQCHRNLGHHEKAIFSFRLYLRKKPNATNRAAVESLIEDLESKAEEERQRKEAQQAVKIPEYAPRHRTQIEVPPPPPPPPPPVSKKPFYKQWWFWVPVATLVAAGGAVGTYFAARPGETTLPDSSLGVWDLSR